MKEQRVKWPGKRKVFMMGIMLFILIPGIGFFIVQKNFISLLIFSFLLLSYFGLLFLLFRNISRIPHIIEELSFQKGYFRKIFNNLGEGLITTDQDGRIDFMNPFAEKLTGWNWRDAKKQPLHIVYNIINERTGEPVKNIVDRVLKDGTSVEWENNTMLKTKDGKTIIISNSGSSLRDGNGKITGAVLLFNDITENIEREKLIKKSEEKYRGIIDQASDGILIYSLDGTIHEFNQIAYQQTGYSREEFSGLKLFDLIYDGKIVTNLSNVEKMKSGENILIQRKIKCKNGSVIEVEISSRMMSDGQLIAIVRDVTQRMETEKALAESENYLRTIIQAEPECVKLIDKEGMLLEMNKAGLEMIEAVSLDQIKGKSVLGIVNEPYRKAFTILTKNVYKGVPGVLEFEITGLKGARRWLETHAVPLKNAEGEIVSLLGVTRDITEKKKVEQEMRNTLERYAILAQATSDTIWDWNIGKNKMHYNYGITQMFGYEIADIENIPEWWKLNIHAEDIRHVNELLKQVFEKKKQTVQMEYRYRCSDGSYKNILDRAFVIYDEKENPLRMIGAMQDITHQKNEEKRINKAIISAQEKERQQIGMELHDNVNQILGASLLYLGMTNGRERSKEFVSEMVNKCTQYIRDAITEIRKLSHQLAPASIKKVSVKEIVGSLVNTVNADNRFQIQLVFEDIDSNNIPEEVRLTIYRILQEQLNNIIKHASAKKIRISIMIPNGSLRLRVQDDGKGFDPKKARTGIGLENIQRRTKMYNGEFRIKSSPGKGCELIVMLPLKKNETL